MDSGAGEYTSIAIVITTRQRYVPSLDVDFIWHDIEYIYTSATRIQVYTRAVGHVDLH